MKKLILLLCSALCLPVFFSCASGPQPKTGDFYREFSQDETFEFDEIWGYVFYKRENAYTPDLPVTDIGYFTEISRRWQAVKGVEALWSLEDKLLFDTLYTMQPNYGLPMEGDIPQGEALVKAMAAVGVTSANDYQIGYGYIMGMGDGQTNGVWEIWFMQGDEMIYKVNLDAVTGEIYLIEPDEEGNG